MTLVQLRKLAETKNVKVAAIREYSGWGYILTDMDGNDLWEDDNYEPTIKDMADKIRSIGR